MNNKLYFIHIGKCGGLSIRKALRDNNISNFLNDDRFIAHEKKPVIDNNLKYLINIRHPIDRLVSAFRYRYSVLIERKTENPKNNFEIEVLNKYKNINNIAQNLDDDKVKEDFLNVHHVRYNISFYLKEFLEKIDPKNIEFVFKQETLNEDLAKFFNTKLKIRTNNFSTQNKTISKSTPLTQKSLENLRKFCKEEFECISKLNRLYNLDYNYN